MKKRKYITEEEAQQNMLDRMVSESQGPRNEEERKRSEERWRKIYEAIERDEAERALELERERATRR